MSFWKRLPPGWRAWDGDEWEEEEDDGGGGGDGGDGGEDEGDDDSGDDGDDWGGGDGDEWDGDEWDGDVDFGGGDDGSDSGDGYDGGGSDYHWDSGMDRETSFRSDRNRDLFDREDDRDSGDSWFEREQRRQEEERKRQEEERRRQEEERRREEEARRLEEEQRRVYAWMHGVEPDELMKEGPAEEAPMVPTPPRMDPSTVAKQPKWFTDDSGQYAHLGVQPGERLWVTNDGNVYRENSDGSTYVIRSYGSDEDETRRTLYNAANLPSAADRTPIKGPPTTGETPRPTVIAAPNEGTRTEPTTPLVNGLPADAPVTNPPATNAQNDAQVAANAAADTTAQAGGTPTQVAEAAATAAVMASDKQTLGGQSAWTQRMFREMYKDTADQEWVKQHEAELARNQRIYGSREPTPGARDIGVADGLPAPDRTIGRTPPPGPNQNARYGVNWDVEQPAAPATEKPAPPAPTVTATGGTGVPIGAPASGLPSSGPPPAVDQRAANRPGERAGGPLPPVSAEEERRQGQQTTPFNPQGSNPVTLDASGQPVETFNRPVKAEGFVPASNTTQGEAISGLPPARGATRDDYNLPPDPVTAALDSPRPLNTLVAMEAQGKGEPPSSVPEKVDQIVGGIAQLMRGEKEGAWTEPYLNDTARIAWAKEERAQGRAADPRQAPTEYVEKWKDALFGKIRNPDGKTPDPPMVKELHQQLLDRAADLTPKDQPFRWQDAYGATGERGLISRQVASNDCGPNAFSTILRSRGYNADPAQTFTFARQQGYHNGSEFTGPENYARMLRDEAGLDAKAAPIDWNVIDKELAEGRPVTLSGPGHYWVISAKDDQGRYYGGATSAVVRNPEWAKPNQFNWGGPPNTMITARGDVDPNARGVKALGLRPAGSTAPQPNRALLSTQYQTAGQRASARVDEGMQAQSAQVPTTQSTAPSPRANLKPQFTVQETDEMRNRILQEMPDFKFDPNDDIETRIKKIAPAVDWLEREYGVSAEAIVGAAYNENGLGAANSPAVKGNNLWSVMYVPQDPLSKGPIPEGRWAQYNSPKEALARFVSMYAHPENGKTSVWAVRGDKDKMFQELLKQKYFVKEPGFEHWDPDVGAELYRQYKAGQPLNTGAAQGKKGRV